MKAFDDEGGYVRYSAALAISRFGEKAKPAIPALIKKFQASEGNDKEILASTFGKIGPPAADALPALESALSETDPFLKIAVASSILRIDAQSRKAPPISDFRADPSR